MADRVSGGQQKRLSRIQAQLERSLQKYLDFANKANRVRRAN